ncbi:hypothetical protein HY995_05100 [Candidatus Micrarchaeota archaeon]|nr:hypothetical protein [Candidatus Micrarchaeota archaeon]
MRPAHFTVFVFILLAAEIVSPFAFAQQSPSPTESSRSIPIASSFPASPPQDAQGASPFTGLQVAGQAGGSSGLTSSGAASSGVPSTSSSSAPASAIPPSTAPVQVGACVISELTPQQSLNFLNAVSGFTGKEVTDRSDASLRKNATTSPTQIVNVYNFPVEDSASFMKLGQLAQITGRGAKELADELGVDDDKDADGKVTTPAADKEVTVAQASALVQKDPKLSGLLGQIRAAAQTKKNVATGPGFEDLKVTLPNGKEVQLSEMFKLQKLRASPGQKNSCLVDNADIRGKLTYNALLDKSLIMGALKSNLSSDEYDNSNTDHLGTDYIRAGINSYDGNIVIPHEYERAVMEMGSWVGWDIILSSALAIGSFYDVKFAEKNLANTEKQIEASKETADTFRYILSQQGSRTPTGDAIGQRIRQAYGRAGIGNLARMTEGEVTEIKAPIKAFLEDKLATGAGKTELATLFESKGWDKSKIEAVTAGSASPSEIEELSKEVSGNIAGQKDIASQVSSIYDFVPKKSAVEGLTKQVSNIDESLVELGSSTVNKLSLENKLKASGMEEQVKSVFGKPTISDAITEALSAPAETGKLEKLLKDGRLETQNRISFLDQYGISSGEEAIQSKLGKQAGLEDAQARLQSEQAIAEKAFSLGKRRAWTNIVMGTLWLGPGRLGLELAGVITLSSVGKPSERTGDYLKIFANSKPAEAFRKGTDVILIGHFLETISNFLPITAPSKVYQMDDVVFTQVPGDTGKETQAFTSIRQVQGDWNVNTNWPGDSTSTAFEDVRDGKAVTTMAVATNNLAIGGTFKRKAEGTEYYKSLLYIAPLLGWRLLGDKTAEIRGLQTILQIEGLQYYIEKIVDPSAFSGKDACSDEQLDSYVNGFKAATTATIAEQVIFFSPFSPEFAPVVTLLKTIGPINAVSKSWPGLVLSKAGTIYSRVGPFVDPFEAWKQTAQSRVYNYALNCKDSAYKILSYQNIPQKSAKANVLQSIQKKVSDPLGVPQITKSLNIGEAFKGIGAQVRAKDLKEILNVKVLLQNQNGLLRPSELYYLHLDPEGADMQWWGVFENQCFRRCQVQADGTFICADNTGVYREKDGKREYLADSDHALFSQLIPGLGQVIPNKIISTPLSCGAKPVFAASGDGKFKIIPGGCTATECAIRALSIVSGQNVGNDLDKVLGPTQAIHTTQGTAVIADGGIRFFRTTGVKVSERNTVLGYIPTIGSKDAINGEQQKANASGFYQQQQSLAGREYRFSTLEILGDGTVRVAGSDKPEEQFGELLTVQSQNAVMHFDRATRRLVIGLQLFADPVAAHDITGIATSAATVTGGKSDLLALERQLADLNSKLASGQQLNAQQLELLRKSIEKNSAPAQAGFTQAERDLLKQALADKNAGKPLSQAEADIVTKSQQQQPYPGVIIVSLPSAEKIDKAASDAGVGDSVKGATNKMRDSLPVSVDDKNAVNAALDKAVAANKLTAADAAQLKTQVQQAVPPAEKAREITAAIASGADLTPEQKLLAQQAVAQEKASVGQQAATATSGQIPAIQLGGVTSKVGAEQSAQGLNRALEKLGGLTQFDSENRRVVIVDDGKGGAVVRVTDKTGATSAQELKVTGAPTKDANGAVSIPTDKGPVSIAVNVNPSTGQPVFNLNGPGGISAPATPLIFAQGPNGYLWFDPKTGTWRTGNGMVIPDDPNFGKNGISFYGGQDGTTGLADQNRFANPRQQQISPYASNNPLLSLPSVPDYGREPLAAMAMLIALLLGVAFVRSREVSPKGI